MYPFYGLTEELAVAINAKTAADATRCNAKQLAKEGEKLAAEKGLTTLWELLWKHRERDGRYHQLSVYLPNDSDVVKLLEAFRRSRKANEDRPFRTADAEVAMKALTPQQLQDFPTLYRLLSEKESA